jgi:molybdate transport system ATP-binding protein
VSDALVADVGISLGRFVLDACVDAGPGELVVLVGPNGAGKTTLLRALAGLVAIDRGRITLGATVLDDPESGTFVAAERRGIGVVFQDGLLFDHLDVADNVAFGVRARGVRRRDARASAITWLQRLGLGGLEHVAPRELSGGQAQRVGLARALAFEPRLLLLDEPFAALDATTRVDVRQAIGRHLAGVDAPKLLVTHDPIEAMALADRIVVLEGGRITQTGTPEAIRAQPRSRYVGDLLGINLLRGTLERDIVTLADGARVVVAEGGAPDGAVIVTLHPHAITLHAHEPDGSARNRWPATVAALDDDGARVRARLDGPVPLVVEITRAARDALELAPGMPVWASCKATEITVQAD